MVHQRPDGRWVVAYETTPGKPSPSEKSIMAVHPAMFRTRPLKYLALVLAVIIGFAGMLYFGVPREGSAVDNWWRPITVVLSVVFAILAAASLLSLIIWLLGTRFESLNVTCERSVWSRGVFDRDTSEIQHDDIRNIQIKQSFIDRILGVGRIAISSAGQDDMEIDIQGVPGPSRVADTVRSYQARMQGRDD
jgi:uncharacterized membrane protein YdbT with pleckstrin-like domain